MEGYIAIIVAVIGASVALWTSHLTKSNQLKFEQMKLKQSFYLKYIKALSDNMNNLDKDDVTIAENHAFNELLLIASPQVLISLYQFKNSQINYLKNNNIDNVDPQLLTSLIKEIRIDLHGSGPEINEGLEKLYMLSGVIKKEQATPN